MSALSELHINGHPVVLDVDMISMCKLRHQATNRRHCNAEYEATIILRGSCHADVDNTQYTLQTGQAILIAPGRYHILTPLSADFDRFCFRFSLPTGALSKQVAKQLGSHRVYSITPEMEHLCHSIFGEFSAQSDYWEDVHFSLLKTLLLYTFRLLELGDPASDRQSRFKPSRTHQIERYIEGNLAQTPSEEDLAQHLGLSRRQTARILQETYGIGFREKLLNARMDRAAWLLRTTQKPLSIIISEVGYSSQSAFFNAFRAHFHTTPLKYRKNNPFVESIN